LLRALVFRAREVLVRRWLVDRLVVERVLLERPLLERVELLRRFWLVVAMCLLLLLWLNCCQLKVINSKDNNECSREHPFENPRAVTSVTETELGV